MEEDKKACWNCRWYSAAYTKGYHRFDKQNFGMCRHDKCVQKNECCAAWQYNTRANMNVKRQMRRQISLKALKDVLEHLSEISQILKENSDDTSFRTL